MKKTQTEVIAGQLMAKFRFQHSNKSNIAKYKYCLILIMKLQKSHNEKGKWQ